MAIFGYYGHFWLGNFKFCSSYHVRPSRYTTYLYLYAKAKGTLKLAHIMAIFGYFGHFLLFLCWVWCKICNFKFCSSCQVRRYAIYPLVYAKSKRTLKIAHFMAIFCYFWPFFGYFYDWYDSKMMISYSVNHAKSADMQHTHICTQNLNALSK